MTMVETAGIFTNNLSTILGSRLIKISTLSINTGIAQSTLSPIYNKKSVGVRLTTLIKICDYLDVPLSDLVEYIPATKGE